MVVQAAVRRPGTRGRAKPCDRRTRQTYTPASPGLCSVPARPMRRALGQGRALRLRPGRVQVRRRSATRSSRASRQENAASPKTAADIERAASAPARTSRRARLRARPTSAARRRSTSALQVLRAAEDVKADELERAAVAADCSRAGTRSASMPNCFGPPLIFMPELFNSKSGFTRIGDSWRRTARCSRNRDEHAAASSSDSTLIVMPAADGLARAPPAVLPGPAKLISSGSAAMPAASATAQSLAAEATSRAVDQRDCTCFRSCRHRIRLHRIVQMDRPAA